MSDHDRTFGAVIITGMVVLFMVFFSGMCDKLANDSAKSERETYRDMIQQRMDWQNERLYSQQERLENRLDQIWTRCRP